MDKILAIMPVSIGGRLTTSSIIDGFKQNGFKITIFDELKNENFSDYLNDEYSYIIGYDFSPIKLKVENKLNIPLVAYFSDDINLRTAGVDFDKLKKELYKNDNYIFYWDRELSKKEKLNYQPHFVNTEVYKDFSLPQKDVLFMGRLDTPIRLDMMINVCKKLPEYSFSWYAIKKHYLDAISRLNDEDKKIIEKIYCGFIDNEQDMAKVINNHKIVYNINAQGISSLNYRTIQTLASKRLVISDFREELDLFDNMIPMYSDFEDLTEKIRYYLSNKEEYEKITSYCQKIVQEKLNSKTCIKNMLKIINKKCE